MEKKDKSNTQTHTYTSQAEIHYHEVKENERRKHFKATSVSVWQRGHMIWWDGREGEHLGGWGTGNMPVMAGFLWEAICPGVKPIYKVRKGKK